MTATRRAFPVLLLALAGVALVALLSGCGMLGRSDDFPNKAVSYVVPFDPGGLNDRAARRQQPILEKSLGQKVNIEYRAGGGGAVAWAELARSKPDGYLVTQSNLPHIILQPLQQDVGYKTEQLVPFMFFESSPSALAVLKTSKYKSLKEFIDAAKANPGKLNVGGVGTFSGLHMTALRLQKLAGIKFEYAPFTGGAPQMTAFLGSHVDAIVVNSGDVIPQLEKARILASATTDRFPSYADAPTFKEQGIDLVEAIDRGVAVPAGTPDKVIQKLEKAFLDAAKDPAGIETQKKEGQLPLAMGYKDAKAHVEKLKPIYAELVAGLKK